MVEDQDGSKPTVARGLAVAKQGLRAVRRVFTPSAKGWKGAAWAVVAVWGLVVLGFAALDVAPRFSPQKLVGLVGFFAVMGLISLGLLFLFWAISALHRGYRWALLLALPPLGMLALFAWGPQGVGLLILLLLGVSLIIGGVTALARRSPSRTSRIAALVTLVVGLLGVGGLVFAYVSPVKDPNPLLADYRMQGQTAALANPAAPGPFSVETFTYGSGTDRHRPEYAEEARFRTSTVDGSKLDDEWKGLTGSMRTAYWGFGPDALPLQGRVWAPQQAGAFPLVLIVHGNHAMEDPSDPGYAYLGETLASQGFVVVSVDQNFMNSSFSQMVNPFKLRGGAENDARAWLLLEHLRVWRGWNADPAHPLHGRVDMSRIGLIGHSRGGEAVATAASFNQLKAWPDDASVAFDYGFDIRGVAAIAPVDGQYRPRREASLLSGVDYLVIHGSMDGDVTTFMGAAQYGRIDPGPDGFKAALYVKDANHGQFNTAWGRNDAGGAMGMILDERAIMAPEAQQQVASVLLGAFLRASLRDEAGYRAVLADPRRGAAWLPDVYLASNYTDGRTVTLANFDEDMDPTTGAPGVGIGGRNLTIWKEIWGKRDTRGLATYQALLAWDDRVSKDRAQYALSFPQPPAASAESEIVFGLSQSGQGSLPPDFKDEEGKGDPAALDWTVVLVDASGQEARVALSTDQVLYPQIRGLTRRIAGADSSPASEIVVRGYRLPLATFRRANPGLDLSNLRHLRFDFDRSPRGSIIVDDIGISGPIASS